MRMKRGKVPHEGSDKGVHNILESQRGKKVIHTMKLSKRSD